MSNTNHVFVGLPALIKNAAASDPIVSAGDNHISGIGFFDAINGGTINRDDLGLNFRNTNFLAVVGTQIYFYTLANLGDPDWTNAANWTEVTNADLTQVIADLAQEVTDRTNADNTLTQAINANTSTIGINTTAISSNTSDIAANAADISTNTADIATNLSSIQSNDTDISNLQGSVATNTTDISTNAGDISTNTTDIATNASGIATNAADISGNDADIATNASNISTNASAITTLDGQVVKKTDSIDELNDVDTSTAVPADGEVLKWNGLNWVPGAGGGVVRVEVKNATTTDFNKGDAVYVSGTAASGKPEIELADNNGTGTYPAIGLLEDDITAGNEGFAVVSGSIFNLNTTSFAAGDSLYVDSTPGAVVNTRPTGATTKVQKVALVKKYHATSGSVIVMGAGRTNDVPNIANGEFWLGNTNGIATDTNFNSAVANTPSVSTNTAKVSATGSVTTHSDVTSAGSGAIITSAERITLGSALQPLDNISSLTNDANYITSTQAPVQSVNTQSGTVVLNADDIDDTATAHKFTTAADIAKLVGIDPGAEVNVNADWNATSGDAEILNKPVIPAAYTDSDVDTHLNTGTAGTNEVLSWTGSDYDWVAQSGGSSNQRTLAVGVSNNDWSGDVVTFGALSGGGNFTQGKLYVWRSGAWEEAYATSVSTSSGMLGIAIESSTTKMLTRGTFTSSSMTAFTTSNILYVSSLQSGNGRMMDSIPATPAANSIIRICGYVINGVSGQIFFDPSQDFIQV